MKVARTVRRRGKGGDRIKSLPISIKFVIFSTLILLPFFIINDINVTHNRQNIILETRYNYAMDTATQDAAKALIVNASQSEEAQYESEKRLRINKEEAVQTFFNSLYLNFNVFNNPVGQGVIQTYVPVILIVGYDGYYVYYMDEYTNASGQKELKHVWSPFKPYAHTDQFGNTFAFTLDEFVTVNRNSDQKWFEGFRSEISPTVGVSLLNDSRTFDQVRRTTIVNAIQKDLEFYINQYNNLAKRNGVSYTFTLPLISQEQWNNTINDVGVLSFVQGIPMGQKYYNNYALGGSRVVKRNVYNGIIVNGRKYYYSRNSCISSFMTEEIFTTEKDAAASGYIPLDCAIGNRQ